MSNQTGIVPDAELIAAFQAAQRAPDGVRALHVRIANEALVLASPPLAPADAFPADLDRLQPWFESATEPSFALVRTDAPTAAPSGAAAAAAPNAADARGDAWIVLHYVPDRARVRDKMLYAASRASLTKALGDACFCETVHGTTREEMSAAGYARHARHRDAEAPLTAREREARDVLRAEQQSAAAAADAAAGTAGRSASAGLAFPIAADADAALAALGAAAAADATDDASNGTVVVLRLDTQAEQFVVAGRADLDADGVDGLARVAAPLMATTPPTPAFVVVAYAYRHGGVRRRATLFVYVCPPASPIKGRMLYSASKVALIETIQRTYLNGGFGRTMEVDGLEEVLDEEMTAHLHPPAESAIAGQTLPTGFARPTRPGRPRPAT
ncbi:hypothetical protein CXG81DRAFT_17417 [Caulochytrium protostelioides]|uniref:ADF-H domain-containing protein n=1 Tax=Caulochytrium protostelioides TaxID=1555241 RepID=A0A4P9XC35_9FUNG|nr:hypothetical protein CXG81DRAFT_17417 [Caulochytrium protostelioides]|eukprot:RKP02976.1 hypothetical protein CXG81DRAFT_17417 [Caulochytrium protostelioides]